MDDYTRSLPLVLACGVACVVIVALTGCSSTKPPETLIVCSVTSDRAFALNSVKAVSIGLEVSPAQVARLCGPAGAASGSAR